MAYKWNQLSFRSKAEYLIDQIDGITEDDIDDIYDEWSEMTFDRSIQGYDEALSALWRIAYDKSLKNLGMTEANQRRIEEQIRQKGLE